MFVQIYVVFIESWCSTRGQSTMEHLILVLPQFNSARFHHTLPSKHQRLNATEKRDVLDISNFLPQVQKEHRQGAGGGQPVRGEEGGRRLAVLRHPDADDVAGAAPGLHGVLDGLRLRPGLGVRRQQLWVRSYARTGAVSISLT